MKEQEALRVAEEQRKCEAREQQVVKEVERMAEGSEYTIHRCANINDMAHTVSINGNPSH
jgi:hypothetical protein